MFARNVLRIGVGNLLAQVISVLAVPVITRLYLPADYGIFSVYAAIASCIFPIVTLRFNVAMLLPEDDSEARLLLLLAVLSVVAWSLFLWVLLPLCQWAHLIPTAWYDSGITKALWLIPLSVLAMGSCQVGSLWAIRQKDFKASATARVIESIADRGFVLTVALFSNPNVYGLIGGRVFGPASSVFYLLKKYLSGSDTASLRSINRRHLFELVGRYKAFAIFSSWASLFDVASRQVPLLLMSFWFLPSIVGYFALATQVVNMPTLVVGDAINNVFMQRCAEHRHDQEKMTQDALILFKYLLTVSILPVITLTVVGREIFALVFGVNWSEAGFYVEIIATSFLITFLHRPFSVYFDILERQRQRLLFDVTVFGARVSITLVGCVLESPIIMVIGITGTTILVYAVGILYLMSLVRLKPLVLVGILTKKIIVYVPTILVLLGVVLLDLSIQLNIALLSMTVVIQFFLLSKVDAEFKSVLRMITSRLRAA